VPADVVSPNVAFARALNTNNVSLDFDEPLDPNSVQKEDFRLTMAGAERPISAATVTPDGRSVILTSSGWRAGEAGYVELTSVGAVTDTSGNAMLTAPRMRVAAAPGDFIAPLGARLSVSPKTICLTHGRGCRKTGMTIKFMTSEAGKARLLVKRSDVTIGTRLYGNIVAGKNTLKFNGRLGARKLRAGRYRLLIYVQDAVGNITDQPPLVLFNVRRVTR
jgi:Big-like domain-containing protein